MSRVNNRGARLKLSPPQQGASHQIRKERNKQVPSNQHLILLGRTCLYSAVVCIASSRRIFGSTARGGFHDGSRDTAPVRRRSEASQLRCGLFFTLHCFPVFRTGGYMSVPIGDRIGPPCALSGFWVASRDGEDFETVKLATFTFRSLGVNGLGGDATSGARSILLTTSAFSALAVEGSTIASRVGVACTGRSLIGFRSVLLIRFSLAESGSALTGRGTP